MISKILKTLGFFCCVAGGLQAEKNGIFLAAGFQYSFLKTTLTGSFPLPDGASITPGQSSMYGAALRFGYKRFFRAQRRNGLRIYVYYNYGYASPTFAGLELNNNAYGVGIDYLFDFLDNVRVQAGIFAGFGLGGSSWTSNQDQMFKKLVASYPNAAVNFSYFQLPLQWGLRVNMNRHHGMEIGVKIPLLHDFYFKDVIKGKTSGITFQRNTILYVQYVFAF
ncbi:outer membrane protein [Helicobacter felis]|uniref:outer membrane protein n=1 Tax=Helicobacter felis TaxID=214 RepID=UPI001F273EFC|nr:outer membrane protein [Helicobacter felis]